VKLRTTLGLRGRLILLLLAAFAILAGLVVWNFVDHREERISDVSTQLLTDAKLIAARQQSIVAQADAILNGLMLHPGLRPDATADDCSRALVATLQQQPQFIQVGRTQPDGNVACAAVPPSGRVSIADRNYFKLALQSREMAVSGVIAGRIVGKPVITFAKAMRDEAGRVTGVLYLPIDLGWLHRELAATRLPEGGRLVVVDAKGTVAMRHPDPEGWVGKSAEHLPLLQRILAAGGEGTMEDIGLDGERKLFAYVKLLDTVSGPIYLWLSVRKAVVEAPARRAALFGIGIMLAVLISTMGLLVLGGNRLVLRPLLILSRVAARFKAGDLTARSGLPHGNDEVGRLAATLDEAAAAIESGERKLVRANHALRVLSAGNRALLRATSEQTLAEEMCRAIVGAGGYRIAWVGYAEHDAERRVRTVAVWGAERDFLDGLKITWDETDSGRSTLGTAIRRGIPVVSNDIAAGPDYAPWRDLAQRHGFASALALPLRVDGAVIGALCICAAEPGAFDDDVVKLLSEAADDLAFGIATQRAQAEHGRTQAALQTAEGRFRAAAEANLDALFVLKSVRGQRGEILDFEFTDLNPRAEEMLGMTHDQVVGQKLCELLPINRTGGFFDKYVAVVTTGAPLEEEFPIDTPEIKAKWLRHQVVRVDDGVAISSRDVTVWKEASAALREREKTLHVIFEGAMDGIALADTQTRRLVVGNAAFCRMLDCRPEDVPRLGVEDLHPESALPHAMEQFEKVLRGEIQLAADIPMKRRDGSVLYVDIRASSVDVGGRSCLLGVFRDITERKANEHALSRANRALRTLSAGNEALVRSTSEEELLQSVVRVIVEHGGYCLATIGIAADDPDKSITPVAWSGVEEGYYSQQRPTWADTEKGQVPIARAIRSGTTQVCRDIAGDPGFAPWRESALSRGYASNIVLPLSDGHRTFGGLSIYSSEIGAFDEEETRLLAELANDLAYGIVTLRTRAERDRITYAHAHHAEILQKSLEQSIQVIADTVEARDPYTAGHQRRVGELATAIAREMGLPEEKIHGIHLAAVIHDLGKIHVPAEILAKPGKLTDIEFMLIKTHPQAGYDILKDVDFPWPIADIVRQHHEKLDGSGYPRGLKDGQILLESRIMTVADVVEAMASHRPYRPALGIEAALKEIERGRGSAYDPAVADACLKLFHEARFAFQ